MSPLLLLLIRIRQLELERDAWSDLARRNTADWSREARAAWGRLATEARNGRGDTYCTCGHHHDPDAPCAPECGCGR